MTFKFIETEIKDLKVIEPQVFFDERGFFLETYKKSDFYDNGIKVEFKQFNHSRSIKGTLRGLHFQKPPYMQAKLVRAIKGKVFDVAVDIRKNSNTYGKYFSIILSEDNKKMLYIPEGFAHGFYTMSEIAEIEYKASSQYSFESEGGIIYDDKDININWPNKDIIISKKDKKLPCFKEIEAL